MKHVVAWTLTICLGLPVFFGMLAAETWVTLNLWRWFGVPMGWPVISLPHIAGLNLLLAILTWRFIPTTKEHSAQRIKEWAYMVTACYVGGFGLHLYMVSR